MFCPFFWFVMTFKGSWSTQQHYCMRTMVRWPQLNEGIVVVVHFLDISLQASWEDWQSIYGRSKGQQQQVLCRYSSVNKVIKLNGPEFVHQ